MKLSCILFCCLMTLFQCKRCNSLLAAHTNETPEQAGARLTRDEHPVPPCAPSYGTIHVWRGVVGIAFFADREYRGEYR